MVTELEILKAEREILQLCKSSEKRIILKGENPILLSANIINDVTVGNPYWFSNLDCGDISSAAFVYLLSKLANCHALINIISLDKGENVTFEEYRETIKQAYVDNFINDLEIRQYILGNNIKALINHIFSSTSRSNCLEVCEFNSSFNFGGLTELSSILENETSTNNIRTQLGFKTSPTPDELTSYGYKFSDDVINRYSKYCKLGVLINKPIDEVQMWPRSMELRASTDFRYNLDKEVALANALLSFLNTIEQELKEKGVHKALLHYKKK